MESFPFRNMEQAPSHNEEHKQREHLAQDFQQALQVVLQTELSVESLNSWADVILDGLVDVTEKVKFAYAEARPEHSIEIGDAYECKAYAYFGLPDVGDILHQAQERLDTITQIKQFVNAVESSDTVITPPDKGEGIEQTGQGTFDERKLLPRVATLLYILEIDLGVLKENLQMVRGNVGGNVVRQTPYYRLVIPELERVVYVCDEEGNATHIFDSVELEQAKISLDELDLTTKNERQLLMERFPNLGRRVVYTQRWREDMVEMLNDWPDLRENSEKQPAEHVVISSNIPMVSTEELDVWRGFYTDEEGKHWAPIHTLKARLGFHQRFFNGTDSEDPVAAKPVKIARGEVKTAYCYEELAKRVADYYHNQVEKNGDWKGFYTDEEGKHWASVHRIADYFGISDGKVRRMLEEHAPVTTEILDHKGKLCEGYCLEEIETIPEIKQYLALPSTRDILGEDTTLHFNEDRKMHMGSADQFAALFGVDGVFMRKYLREHPQIDRMEVRNKQGREGFLYAHEALLADTLFMEKVQDLRDLNQWERPEKTGDIWERFYTDEEGNHWSTVEALAVLLRVSRKVIIEKLQGKNSQEIVLHFGDNIKRKEVGYCLEDIARLDEMDGSYKFQEEERVVSNNPSDPYRGFWTDENGMHWGPLKQIERVLGGIEREKLRAILEGNNLPIKQVRALTNRVLEGYPLETVLEIPDITIYFKQLPQAAYEGEWRGMHTDDGGEHWGSILVIAQKIGRSPTFVTRLVRDNEIRKMTIRNVMNKAIEGFSYEDVVRSSGTRS